MSVDPKLELIRLHSNDLQRAEAAIAETSAQLRELSAIVKVTQEQNEKRLDKLETLGTRLLVGVLLLSTGGAAAGQLMAKLLGG